MQRTVALSHMSMGARGRGLGKGRQTWGRAVAPLERQMDEIHLSIGLWQVIQISPAKRGDYGIKLRAD
ncbi:MAG: hypothetical protein J2P44_02940 [Candidatus Dormibacteraeota bacterium]|nr:hypothetical protein [Candidatus Dormibacteraeota bacterium]